MRIQCKITKISSIPEYLRKNHSFGSENLPLIAEKEYIVYAMTLYLDTFWYCIADENFKYYPNWLPNSVFNIVDNSIPRYWRFFCESDVVRPILTFQEWVSDPYFWDKLTDCEPDEIEIFRKYKERMDLEFPDPKVTESAQLGDENWLICPKCIDAWESRNTIDALVKCPKCEKIYNNPRYDKDWRMRNNL